MSRSQIAMVPTPNNTLSLSRNKMRGIWHSQNNTGSPNGRPTQPISIISGWPLPCEIAKCRPTNLGPNRSADVARNCGVKAWRSLCCCKRSALHARSNQFGAKPVGGRMPARGGAHHPDRVDSNRFGRSTKGPSIAKSHDKATWCKETTLV